MWRLRDYSQELENLQNMIESYIMDRTNRDAVNLPLNLYEDEDSVYAVILCPGVNKDQVELSYQNGILSVEVEKSIELEEKPVVLRKERLSGTFKRNVPLGELAVDPAKIQAKYADGILEIEMKKREENKPKKITVQ
jgi:HSP20 family protein